MMIKDKKKFEEFERELLKRERVDFVKNFYILEEMYKESVELGVFPVRPFLSGLEVDIKIARIVNSVSKVAKKGGKRVK
jgi:hypothetical protein